MITTNIKLFFSLLFLLCTTTASADTVIEFKNDGQQSQFLTNGKMARINTRGSDDFMIVNFSTSTIYSVTPENKQIFNISSSIASSSFFEPPKIRIDIKPAGHGPNIAGYKTKKYRMSANGTYCGTLYASRDALKGTDIENMFGSLKTIADNHLNSLGGFAAVIPDCQMARMRLADKLPYIGAPMRMIDIEGEVLSEITKIRKTARVEPRNYALPANYKNVSASEKIDQLLSDSTETDDTKNKTETPRESQRLYRMSPEAMERYRYYQEMGRQR
ncbi:MAG: hypothetical protein JSW45_06145 [Thiotrichales bacterium]|nr:MAG: hypothetical protein JSW45_06145 [Thiotrichales bacterium]